MSGARPQGGLLTGGPPSGKAKSRPRPPGRLVSTPSTPGTSPWTPSSSSGGSSTGSSQSTSSSFSSPSPAKEVNINMDILEKLHIGDKVYTFAAEDLEDRGYIGEGNFGTVSKMFYTTASQEMAVKKIPTKDLKMTDRNEIMELAVVMKAKHCPHIVGFFGCLLRDGHVWICMELLDSSMAGVGEIVYSIMKERIPENILGKMSTSVVEALHFLQKEIKIIHRDVKPSNILMSARGEFKLCDFGISGKLVDSIAKTMEVGCRPYMAPERIDPLRASLGYTIQSDVWSFGITLVELAVGSFPYGKWKTIFDQLNAVVSGPPPTLPEDGSFSPALTDFVSKCLIKDPDERPDYVSLQKHQFLVRSSSEQVDVAGWYQNVISHRVTPPPRK